MLLDEIAAGTDPDEGGPLAQAILERLVGAGACVLVTTHLGSLKEWAVGFRRRENAAVAIDPATLRPRYAISIGSYGASHALDIAESLGLPDAVIGRGPGGDVTGTPALGCADPGGVPGSGSS